MTDLLLPSNSNAERYEKEHYRIEEKTNERSG